MHAESAAAVRVPARDPCETWGREQLRAYQLERLRAQLAYVETHSAYYRTKFAEARFRSEDLRSLDDLRQLPFTRKADYVAALDRARPYGEFVAAPLNEIRRIHFSSGTTATPAPQFWTEHDLDRWAGLYARYAHAQGVGPGDVYQCLFGYAWFVGGLGATAGYQRVGATCIPAGNQDTERQLRTMFQFGVTALSATPSFAAHLADTARSLGLDPRESKVRTIMLGGEPGASLERDPRVARTTVGRPVLRRVRQSGVSADRLGMQRAERAAPGGGLPRSPRSSTLLAIPVPTASRAFSS